jgi:hypothetical protein
LPPGWQPPPPDNQPTDSQLLAMAQQQKNAADLETDRGKAHTERAKALQDDDLQRDKAALDAWTKTWVAAAQFGTPAPSLTEFQQAMRSAAPRIGLLQDVPPPTSPMQPATGVQSLQQPQPGGPPQGQMGQRPPGAQQGRPMMPNPNQPTQMPGPGSPDPATAMGVRQALQTGQLPTAYGQIGNRAIAGLVAGMGGPQIPRPPAPGGPTP